MEKFASQNPLLSHGLRLQAAFTRPLPTRGRKQESERKLIRGNDKEQTKHSRSSPRKS